MLFQCIGRVYFPNIFPYTNASLGHNSINLDLYTSVLLLLLIEMKTSAFACLLVVEESQAQHIHSQSSRWHESRFIGVVCARSYGRWKYAGPIWLDYNDDLLTGEYHSIESRTSFTCILPVHHWIKTRIFLAERRLDWSLPQHRGRSVCCASSRRDCQSANAHTHTVLGHFFNRLVCLLCVDRWRQIVEIWIFIFSNERADDTASYHSNYSLVFVRNFRVKFDLRLVFSRKFRTNTKE